MITDSGGNHQWMLKNGPSSSPVTKPLAMWLWWSPIKRWSLFTLSYASQLSPDGLDSKESAWNAGDTGSIPELRTSPGEGNGYPLQYSCLENSIDRGAWWALYSPWGCKESLTTEWLTFSLSCVSTGPVICFDPWNVEVTVCQFLA